MHVKELVSIGLSEKEAAVYLALLELGSDTVQNIAKKSGVNRATTYVILDALKKKGVASTVEKGTKTHFQAESPDALRKLIRFQEAEIKEHEAKLADMLPELRGVFNRAENKPIVRFFEGKEGLLQIVEDIFSQTPADSEVLNVYNVEVINTVFTEQERSKIIQSRLKKRIRAKDIYTSATIGPTNKPSRLLESVQLTDATFLLPGDVTIYGNRVALSSLKDRLSGVIIESPVIAQTLRSLFLLAFEAAKARVKLK